MSNGATTRQADGTYKVETGGHVFRIAKGATWGCSCWVLQDWTPSTFKMERRTLGEALRSATQVAHRRNNR